MSEDESLRSDQYERKCKAASFFESEVEIQEVRIELHRAFNLYKIGGVAAGDFLKTLESVVVRVKAGLGYYHYYKHSASEESVKVNLSSVRSGNTLLGFQAEANDALGFLELLRDSVLEIPGSVLPSEIDLKLFDELERHLSLAYLRYQQARASMRKSEHGKRGAEKRGEQARAKHLMIIEIAKELIGLGYDSRQLAGIIEKRGDVDIKARRIRTILKNAGF